jgi:hypothetical protein
LVEAAKSITARALAAMQRSGPTASLYQARLSEKTPGSVLTALLLLAQSLDQV